MDIGLQGIYQTTNSEITRLLTFIPLLPRLRCSASWEFSASGCLSVASFRLPPMMLSSAGNKREGVAFFLVTFSWLSKKK
jgi:hypothetical protein